ncbi:glycerophosphodiester phosphodiesterase family protein [Pantanalinema rosaneae CENA516]|uniref:glycerophosphodiester phosphodiesterase family protein n=1 Tax=Pantanalinema rosaneae TaxID=1620701 RepID=UPI003D6F181C
MKPFDVQGHRGARGRRPENTLPAFEYAIEVGVTTLELDTGISADGVVVVCHNPIIHPQLCIDGCGDRLPDFPPLYLKDLMVEEIQSFDCGSLNPDPQQFPDQQLVPGTCIPTLQQVFDLAESRNPQIRYNIESKVNPLHPQQTYSAKEFAEKLVALIEQNQLTDRAMIQSFDWRVLHRVKQLNPTISTVALISHRVRGHSTLRSPTGGASPFLAEFDFKDFQGDLVALLQATGFVDVYSPNFETLLPESPDFIQPLQDFHAAGFPVIPWTVNHPHLMQHLIHLGVDGLITDFPDRLLQLLTEKDL